MEIELVPEPGPDDPSARAALAAIAGELAKEPEAEADWGLVPHSAAWRLAAVRDAVGRGDELAERPAASR